MRPYNLLAIDPGSERSAFLRCRVEPPDEWALPFGVVPQILEWKDNGVALGEVRLMPASVVAIEVMKGIYVRPGKAPQITGRDQMEAQLWAGAFMGDALTRGRDTYRVTRATATSVVCAEFGGKAKGDVAVKAALLDIYGGEAKAIGGGRCKTCKKAGGWIGRDHADCPNCKAGHGDTGHESPRGVFHGWAGSHGFAALAVAIVAAQRIGR